ncbi:MAG: IS21 family transposase [Clostridia bacterium]|nr:IS21 family transposase [Clostridia bacterium]
MIKLKTKQEIILMHIRDGKSQREIARITGRDRKTIRKYIREYEESRRNLIECEGVDAEEIVSSIVENPKYDTSNREKKKLTDAVVNRIKFYLDENEKRIDMGIRKQIRKKIDIHEALVEEGIDIGYTTVCQAVTKILNESKEAFIRCEYNPGDTCEFDWGEVKLLIDGTLITLHMAAFCTARGNYRFGRLYANEKTESFLEAHAEFFSHIKGNHRTMVYDNMRTAVKKFVGRHEKEPTEALLKISMYYCYQYRFCNAYSGNEKGHVEKTVDYLRGKAFARRLDFSSIEEANGYLLQVCNKLNDKEQKAMENKTAAQMLEEERDYLMPSLPPFDCAVVRNYRVNKYSTINVDGCFYSVPDNCVDKLVLTKVYTGKIIIFYEGQKLAQHTKLLGYGKWSLDINHYLSTLKKKPGALTNSLALQQAHTKISNLYEKHFTTNKRDFVELLLFMKDYDVSIELIESAVAKLLLINPVDISADKIKLLCTNCDSTDSTINRQDEIYKNSRNILNLYGQLLNADSDNFSDEEVAL